MFFSALVVVDDAQLRRNAVNEIDDEGEEPVDDQPPTVMRKPWVFSKL